MYLNYSWLPYSSWTEPILQSQNRTWFLIWFLRSFKYSTYWIPFFKIFKKGDPIVAEEGFKCKLAAILSAIDDKVPCILVTR